MVEVRSVVEVGQHSVSIDGIFTVADALGFPGPTCSSKTRSTSARSSVTGEDLSVEHVIDLDRAAAEITSRLPVWAASGLDPGPITWRDAAATWPQPLETDRALVTDPDSVGVRVVGSDEWTEVQIVLYRGGWADLDALTDDEVTTECPQVPTPKKFGVNLGLTEWGRQPMVDV
ncbi:hypothetical protein [Actinocorallia sp. A-T 12471]|uniref:hypothetical protein n=1 Tax=Actinocorallia sp. A-T 12471 TaxID=3089813 RepID=UPI0029CD8FD7|nr:hypothetical protein [Actinocorallia sp. A-T 12471]MDX6738133.1 hypothetical protein [Actinocorallia sp. A-T 12471]